MEPTQLPFYISHTCLVPTTLFFGDFLMWVSRSWQVTTRIFWFWKSKKPSKHGMHLLICTNYNLSLLEWFLGVPSPNWDVLLWLLKVKTSLLITELFMCSGTCTVKNSHTFTCMTKRLVLGNSNTQKIMPNALKNFKKKNKCTIL